MNKHNLNRVCGLRDEYRDDQVGRVNEIRLLSPRFVVPLKRSEARAENDRKVFVSPVATDRIKMPQAQGIC